MKAWGAGPDRKVILNLPSTVEVSTPNIFADQIEWMHRRLARREGIVLSVHPHNDRGCAVAAAELAQLAGAQRVEGCLFGNGERTGNVDLVTLALNLYTQGISPGLDFSEIERIARVTEECTRMPIHPRHPYAGDLVYTAFSGSHQDAIRKGMAAQRAADHWQVPYLPIDPQDLGRDYRALVRINSQSGKGGIAFLLERSQGLSLPRRLQIEFAAAVQRTAETLGTEIDADQLWELFAAEYLQAPGPLRLLEHHCANTETPAEYGASAPTTLCAAVEVEGRALALTGQGNGPIAAFVHALRLPLELRSYEEHALGEGAMARAAAFVEMSLPGVSGSRFGVGLHENIVTAALKAVCSAANRLLAADRSGSGGISQRPLHPLAQ
jgi:2-isopropylmalate synthase